MAATTVPPSRLLPEDLLRMPDDGWRYELIAGELHRMPPDAMGHGRWGENLAYPLSGHVRRHRLGRVYTNVGFTLVADPATVLGPDISFVRTDREPPIDEQSGFVAMAPDLAVEIPAPSNGAGEIVRTVRISLAAGVRLVWIVDPLSRTVAVHHPDRTARMPVEGEVLDGEDVVPGFALPVAEVFA
jgi:Uma2 family endonuclease